MTSWQWPIMKEPPIVPLPKKAHPVEPELPPPIDPIMPIPGEFPTEPPEELLSAPFWA